MFYRYYKSCKIFYSQVGCTAIILRFCSLQEKKNGSYERFQVSMNFVSLGTHLHPVLLWLYAWRHPRDRGDMRWRGYHQGAVRLFSCGRQFRRGSRSFENVAVVQINLKMLFIKPILNNVCNLLKWLCSARPATHIQEESTEHNRIIPSCAFQWLQQRRCLVTVTLQKVALTQHKWFISRYRMFPRNNCFDNTWRLSPDN